MASSMCSRTCPAAPLIWGALPLTHMSFQVANVVLTDLISLRNSLRGAEGQKLDSHESVRTRKETNDALSDDGIGIPTHLDLTRSYATSLSK